ncbi:MAG TPA: hypothetical protein PLS41_09575, partial [Bacteroidales bacterium]|nr:hypothetical protein [Bacteroidales bacterium]
MRELLFFFLLLFFLPEILFSQSKSLLIATGGGVTALKNENMSPLTYYGPGAHGYLGFIEGRPKGIHQLSLYGGASFTSPVTGSSIMHLYAFDFDYTYLRKSALNAGTGINFYAGGAFTMRFAMRNHLHFSNNNFDMDQAYSLAVAGMAERAVKLKRRNLDFQWKLTMPLVSVSIVPGYIGRQPEGFIINEEDKNWLTPLRSSEVLSFGSFFRMISDFGISWNFINGNAIFAKYRWDFTQNTSGNYIADAKHHFSFGFDI